MRKLLLTTVALVLAVPALAAQQDIAQISAVTASREELRTAVNTQLSAVQANFDEVYAVIDAGPVYVNASALADTKVVWIDTDQDNAIKVRIGEVWTVVGTAGEAYTLPTAAADTGGVKVGARLTITDGVLSADVQTGDGDDLGSAAYSDVVALWTTCTGYLKSDGTCDTPSGSATYPSAAGVANWGGSAWGTSYTVGTGNNNLVQLNGAAQLPAVSGALLTGSFTGTLIGTQNTLSGAIQTIGTELDGQDELRFDSDDFTETAGIGTVTVSIDKSAVEATQPSTLELTTNTSITSTQLLENKYFTNQGASAEVDVILPAVSYHITRTVVVEENQIIEVCPPSGEAFDLSGTALDADDCIDSPTVVGSKSTFTRMRDSSGAYQWSVDVVRGTWVDTGASD